MYIYLTARCIHTGSKFQISRVKSLNYGNINEFTITYW